MRLLVIGATGGTGKQIVSQALQASHDVTAFVRDRTRAGADQPRLRIITGDVHDGPALTEAIRGHDVVMSALGRGYSFKSEQLIQRAVPVLIGSMKSAGVRRLDYDEGLGALGFRARIDLGGRIEVLSYDGHEIWRTNGS